MAYVKYNGWIGGAQMDGFQVLRGRLGVFYNPVRKICRVILDKYDPGRMMRRLESVKIKKPEGHPFGCTLVLILEKVIYRRVFLPDSLELMV